MEKKLTQSQERGVTDVAWLKSVHHFTFGSFYDPAHMSFGMLRAFNEHQISPGASFGNKSIANTEVITLVLSGTLKYEDQNGNNTTANAGSINLISTGAGLTYTQSNHSKTSKLNILDIQITSEENHITPHFQSASFKTLIKKDKIIPLLNQSKKKNTLYVNQKAQISIGHSSNKKNISYKLSHPQNGVYIFILSGKNSIAGVDLNKGDALEITDTKSFSIKTKNESEFLVIEVPMY